jgi:hypothetical protein
LWEKWQKVAGSMSRLRIDDWRLKNAKCRVQSAKLPVAGEKWKMKSEKMTND